MALVYRNRHTGKVAVMPEAVEARAQRGPKAAIHARRALEKMDEARKWERLSTDSEIEAAQADWERQQAAKSSRRRNVAPTPVVVVGQQGTGQPQAEPQQVGADGVRPAGGGWHEVVVDGEVVDKIRGRDAAEAAYAERTAEPAE